MKIKTLIRTVLTALALINTLSVMTGKNPLPWSDEDVYMAVSAVLTVITTVWSWWKNNSFTNAAVMADEYLEEIRKNEYN